MALKPCLHVLRQAQRNDRMPLPGADRRSFGPHRKRGQDRGRWQTRRIDGRTIAALRGLVPLAPLHQPVNLDIVVSDQLSEVLPRILIHIHMEAVKADLLLV